MNNINYETIISSFDDKGTLLKWLKTIDAELQGAKVTSSSWRVVEGEESNTAYLTLTTSDGVSFETEGLVMPKVTSAIIIDVINQAIAIYDEQYGGALTLQEFVSAIEEELEEHRGNLDELNNKVNSLGATEGQVLTSNGNGTSAWKDASGGKMYCHKIRSSSRNISFLVYSTQQEPFTNESLANFLNNIGCNSNQDFIPINTIISSYSTGSISYYYGIAYIAGSVQALYTTAQLQISGSSIGVITTASLTQLGTFADVVTEL